MCLVNIVDVQELVPLRLWLSPVKQCLYSGGALCFGEQPGQGSSGRWKNTVSSGVSIVSAPQIIMIRVKCCSQSVLVTNMHTNESQNKLKMYH